MSLLLDTHALLWWLTDDPILSTPARDALADPAQDLFVSAASAWEIAIKSNMGKLHVTSDWLESVEAGGITPLDMSIRHAKDAGDLPFLHRDPFDRMIVAQAQALGLTIVTRDRNIARYGVPVLRA